jgi:hypothetical protein
MFEHAVVFFQALAQRTQNHHRLPPAWFLDLRLESPFQRAVLFNRHGAARL